MSKNLLLPNSPLDEILINSPFLSSPINLKFESFFDKGVIILFKSISIFLLIFFKVITFCFFIQYFIQVCSIKLFSFDNNLLAKIY